MAPVTTPVEPITAEPVIVEVSDAQQPKASPSEATAVGGTPVEDNGTDKPSKPEDAPIPSRGRRRSPSPRPGNSRDSSRSPSRSPSVRIHRRYHRSSGSSVPLTDSQALEKILDLTDVCVKSVARDYNNTAYVTCHALHPTDVEKQAWLFTSGTPDAWAQRPRAQRAVFPAAGPAQYHYPGRTRNRRYDPYESDFDADDDADATPIVRLGSSLRVFRGDASTISKVKFVIAVEGRKSAAWAKLLICYSREAALTAIIHEIACSRSIPFVGAVLKDAPIPANPTVQFKWASSLQELEEVEDGVIGVVC